MEQGTYSICPLCDEHLRWPDVPEQGVNGVFYEPEALARAHAAEVEAMLAEHVRTHTAQVILDDE